MNVRHASLGSVGLVAMGLLLGACSSSDGGGDDNTAGTAAGGTLGGGGTAGASGETANAGSSGASTAGQGGAEGTAGGNAGGSAGVQAGGAGGVDNGGAGGESAGSGGTGGAAMNLSAGCGMLPRDEDSTDSFVKYDIMVPGVDPAFISANPPTNAGEYTWTARNFYLRLPQNYDVSKPYAIDIAGTGCGGNATVGASGDYILPPMSTQTDAIQVALSYVPSSTVNTCATFADDFTNSPEPMYLNAIIDELEAKYCIDKNKVFVNGYSSGAWEAVMSGCTNQDKVRAYGVQIGGGLRISHPTCLDKPAAAFFVVGTADTGNPIGPLDAPLHDSYGSAPARDEQLVRNGCVASDFAFTHDDVYGNAPHAEWNPAYPKCQMYTGCPAEYPVVWCPLDVNHGDGPNPTGTDGGAILASYRLTAMWEFFMSLPAPSN